MNTSTQNNNISASRLHAIDEIRGIAIILMVLYHGLYYMTFMFQMPNTFSIMHYALYIEPIICSAFILLCGVSSTFSHSNIKRGIRLLVIALAITVGSVLIMPNFAVYFGILHFLSIATILFGLFKKPLSRVSPYIALPVCGVLFVATYGVLYNVLGIPGLLYVDLPEFLTSTDYLFILGFRTPDFFSSDYFPLFPWIFLFLFGAFLGFFGQKYGFAKWLYKKRCPPLAFLGRHSLLIYIVHIPVVYGLVYILNLILFK